MRVTIENLKDTFKIGYETYEPSRKEAFEVVQMYHNNHYTKDQLATLGNRGQPAETFNIVKLYTRNLVGYFSTVINDIQIKPRTTEDITTAALLNDTVSYILEQNDFERIKEKMQIDAMLVGLQCCYVDVVETDKTDDYGRKIYDIELEHVPASQIVIDPMSIKEDYSDARFIHRFKWMSEERVRDTFGKYKTDKLVADYNHLEIPEGDFRYTYTDNFHGKYKHYNNYLVVHSIMIDEKGKSWSVFWCGDIILDKKEITYKEVKFPYLVVKTNDTEFSEYYGIYREVKETQKAIDQAILQIQQLANTNKVMVETNAVEDIDEFTTVFNRVNSVVEVLNLNGIRVENLSGDIINQYNIINNALDRIQRLLGINDSFLGMASASDSGRKVKLQQNASLVALRYMTTKMEFAFKRLGQNMIGLIKQYYRAEQSIRITDPIVGDRWIQINQPIIVPTGRMLPGGIPHVEPIYTEAIDPATQEPIETEEGEVVVVPVNQRETDIQFTDADVKVETVSYNDTDDADRILLESMIQGQSGQFLLHSNPAAYSRVAGLAVRQMKSRYSNTIAEIYDQTAQMLQPQAPTQDPRAMMSGGRPELGPGGGSMMSAAGMTSDQLPLGYNQPR